MKKTSFIVCDSTKELDSHRNVSRCFLGNFRPLRKILLNSCCHLLRYTAKSQFTRYHSMLKNCKWFKIHKNIRIDIRIQTLFCQTMS